MNVVCVVEWTSDHQTFRPARWLEYDPSGRKQPDGYMPFGAGSRTCLGYPLALAEMRAYLALLARGYSYEMLSDPFKNMAPYGAPSDGMPMKLQPL